MASREAVIGVPYENELREVLRSSARAAPHMLRWYNREGAAEDPWISLVDHHSAIASGDLLYGGANFGWPSHIGPVRDYGGMNVLVRRRRPAAEAQPAGGEEADNEAWCSMLCSGDDGEGLDKDSEGQVSNSKPQPVHLYNCHHPAPQHPASIEMPRTCRSLPGCKGISVCRRQVVTLANAWAGGSGPSGGGPGLLRQKEGQDQRRPQGPGGR
jgi:hypothetical protein